MKDIEAKAYPAAVVRIAPLLPTLTVFDRLNINAVCVLETA